MFLFFIKINFVISGVYLLSLGSFKGLNLFYLRGYLFTVIPNLCNHSPKNKFFLVSRTLSIRKNQCIVVGYDPLSVILIGTFALSLLHTTNWAYLILNVWILPLTTYNHYIYIYISSIVIFLTELTYNTLILYMGWLNLIT